jgi:hypothetical protein
MQLTMRIILLASILLFVGCESTQRIDLETLDQRYQETQLAEGVLSIVPLRADPNQPPPKVVKWWYAGSSDTEHKLVYRELTWDSAGKPVGKEQRYSIARSALTIHEPFAYTSQSAYWIPLYEAAQAIEPPADLPTARKAPKPFENQPIRRPDDAPVAPPTID